MQINCSCAWDYPARTLALRSKMCVFQTKENGSDRPYHPLDCVPHVRPQCGRAALLQGVQRSSRRLLDVRLTVHRGMSSLSQRTLVATVPKVRKAIAWKSNVQHSRQADDLGTAVKAFERICFRHEQRLRNHSARLKPICSDRAFRFLFAQVRKRSL